MRISLSGPIEINGTIVRCDAPKLIEHRQLIEITGYSAADAAATSAAEGRLTIWIELNTASQLAQDILNAIWARR